VRRLVRAAWLLTFLGLIWVPQFALDARLPGGGGFLLGTGLGLAQASILLAAWQRYQARRARLRRALRALRAAEAAPWWVPPRPPRRGGRPLRGYERPKD
jgi:hypothetical protein